MTARLAVVPVRNPATLTTRKVARAKLDLLLDRIREWHADHVSQGGSGSRVLELQALVKAAAREWAAADRELRRS